MEDIPRTAVRKNHPFVRIGWIFFFCTLITAFFAFLGFWLFDIYDQYPLWMIVVALPGILCVVAFVISVGAVVGEYRSKGVYRADSAWVIILLFSFPIFFFLFVGITELMQPLDSHSDPTAARVRADLYKIASLEELCWSRTQAYATSSEALQECTEISIPKHPVTGDEYEFIGDPIQKICEMLREEYFCVDIN